MAHTNYNFNWYVPGPSYNPIFVDPDEAYKVGVVATVKIPENIFSALPWVKTPEDWQDYAKSANGKQVKLNSKLYDANTGENGWRISYEVGYFNWIPQKWLVPNKIEANPCNCSARDLLTFGHKCGRKAPIDRR